jgi:type III secretory pathway component EscS
MTQNDGQVDPTDIPFMSKLVMVKAVLAVPDSFGSYPLSAQAHIDFGDLDVLGWCETPLRLIEMLPDDGGQE